MGRFVGKVAVITGGATGIGFAATRRLHAEGASAAIVNVSSVSGMAGDHGLAAYNAAKAGALNFTRSLALELAPRRIRVNAISPGAVDTPLAAATSGTPVIAGAFRAAIPVGRFGRPEEIAAAIAFLAADESSFVIGANLAVDGGLTAGTGHPNMLTMFGDSWWTGADEAAAQ